MKTKEKPNSFHATVIRMFTKFLELFNTGRVQQNNLLIEISYKLDILNNEIKKLSDNGIQVSGIEKISDNVVPYKKVSFSEESDFIPSLEDFSDFVVKEPKSKNEETESDPNLSKKVSGLKKILERGEK